MVTSRVPAAVAALLDILRAAPSLAEVHIEDGPTAVNYSDLDRIYVGWQPNADSAVAAQQDFNGAGARTRDESFTIACYAESRSGDTGMEARRERVYEIVAVVEQALRATDAAPTAPTLNDTVMWAHVTSGDLYQQQSANGAIAGVDFQVSCFARLN